MFSDRDQRPASINEHAAAREMARTRVVECLLHARNLVIGSSGNPLARAALPTERSDRSGRCRSASSETTTSNDRPGNSSASASFLRKSMRPARHSSSASSRLLQSALRQVDTDQQSYLAHTARCKTHEDPRPAPTSSSLERLSIPARSRIRGAIGRVNRCASRSKSSAPC